MYRKGFYKDSDIEPPNVQDMELYLYAFAELGTCRDGFGGAAPIPFTAIAKYAEIYDVGDFDDFLHVIRKMDDKLLELETNKKEKESKKTEAKNGGANTNKNNPNQNLGRGVGRA